MILAQLFFFIIFPSIVALCGVLVTMVGLRNLRRARASKSWPTIMGTVAEAKLHRHSGDVGSSDSFSRAVTYRYTVQGAEYTSNVVSFRENCYSEGLAEAALRPYRKGHQVKVYYDPHNPQVSTLEVGHDGGNYVGIGVGILFAVVGIALFILLNFIVDRKDMKYSPAGSFTHQSPSLSSILTPEADAAKT